MPVSLKIKLKRDDDKIFLPGSFISGEVLVKDLLKGTVRVRDLRLKLIGVIETFQVQGPYSELHEVRTVVNEEIELLEKRESVEVSKDTPGFPFSIQLPETAPPTIVVNRLNSIKYWLEAEIPRKNKLAPRVVAKKKIIVLNAIPRAIDGRAFVHMEGEIPAANGDEVVQYGDGEYEIDGFDPPKYVRNDYDDDGNPAPRGLTQAVDRVKLATRTKSNRFLPQKQWGAGEIYHSKLMMDVVFPDSGIYSDQPVPIQVKITASGDLPRLILALFKVTLVETTFISAKTLENHERKHHTLLRIPGPLDLSEKRVHDFSDIIAEQAKFPKHMAPSFKEDTMARSYTLHVHIQYYKGTMEDEVPIDRLHMHARQEAELLGEASLDNALPSYKV